MDTNRNLEMLILQSKNKYSLLLELNHMDGTYREIQRVVVDGEFSKIKINGVFDLLNGTLVAIYAIAGQIILRIENRVISLNKGTEVVVNGDPSNRLLQINQCGIELASVRYSISNALVFNDDPTPFVESEDFDFGLFASNLASNADRRSVALENW